MGSVSEDVPQLLCQVHNRVRNGLQHETVLADLPVGKNAKGDTQQRFDVVADAIIRRALTESVHNGILLSEESGEVRFGTHSPTYRFILDPVDGSDNWGRGLPLSAVSIAVLPRTVRPGRGTIHVRCSLVRRAGSPSACGLSSSS